jgi:hypothetical protein
LDAPVLVWTDEKTCVTGRGTEFVTLGREGSFGRSFAEVAGLDSSPERFVLLKTREGIDRYVEMIRMLEPRRIVDLGIYRGGSTALLMDLAKPEMLVAIECERERVAALDAYLARCGLEDRCHTCYGVDQADRNEVAERVDASFGSEPLDLVVDDASHLGPQTRASFETLFPRLRAGGLYIIEDWSWHLQGLDLPGESMEGLVSQLLAAAGRGPGLIAGIDLMWDVILVRRGVARVDASTFDVAQWFDRML